MTSSAPTASFTLDFVVVGSRKCATTWLYELFVAHPEIRVSTLVKESGYFGRNFGNGRHWYEGLFPTAGDWRLTGEVDADLIRNAGTIERIGVEFPQARIIALFRNPADLFFSSFDHATRKGDLSCNAETAWRDYPEFRDELQFGSMMQRLLAAFPRERLHIILYEDIERDPRRVLAELGQFLSLQAPFPEAVVTTRVNVSRNARLPALTKALSRGARLARQLGLHRLVQMLKQSPGAKNLYEAKDRNTVERERSGALRGQVLAELAEQVDLLEQLSGLPVRRRWLESQ